MYIYSGDCRFCKTGIPTNLVDVKGNKLFTGDIVTHYTLNANGNVDTLQDGLTVIVRDDFDSYQGGVYVEKDDVGEPFCMGIKGCHPVVDPETLTGETVMVSDIEHGGNWHLVRVKSYQDVVDGEHWKDFGFSFREPTTAGKGE